MPSSFTDVNFIPDEVVSSRKHATQVKSLNKIALSIMFIALLAGFGLLGYNLYTASKISAIETQVVSEEARISELNEFAESGYKLGNRLAAIKGILNKRTYHWKIFAEIYEEVPSGIEIGSIQMGEAGSVVVTGSSFPNYIPIAVFQDNLKNSESGYFSNIRLRSASLDKTSGNVTFTVDFLVDLPKTYEPIQ